LDNLDIVIFGASGDLAKKKIFPAFFSLFCRNLLPKNVKFFGYARTQMSKIEFENAISLNLTCRYTPESNCSNLMKEFLERCFYISGDYNNFEDFIKLENSISENKNIKINRIYYLAVPPILFADIACTLKKATMVVPDNDTNVWSKIIIEKPFGRDLQSSDETVTAIGKCFSEKQTYRIDHYLGKEIVQNILVFRFANIIFQPVWSSEYIEKIQIKWSEKNGLEGRAGYFDNYGIIRDVIQNHLLQVLALITMEPPENLNADEIRNKKVKVLKDIQPLSLTDAIIGQYDTADFNQQHFNAYIQEKGVPNDSITPTFAFLKLKIHNSRWNGLPVEISAGKALKNRKAEIIITFKKPCGNIFCVTGNCPPANKLVIRIQPDEGFHFIVATKSPGRKLELQPKELDLSYHTAFKGNLLPDAYENLLLDAIKGDKTLFIRNDELRALWNILTPLLHQLEKNHIKPLLYKYGTSGPKIEHFKKEPCQNETTNSKHETIL
jgi:glucose-6-phosphate 1-dehydrogenase